MDYQELITQGLVALIAGSGIIQLSPININPWSWLAKKIGRAFNGEVLAKVDKIETRLDKMEYADGEREAKTVRMRILRFGDECQHGMKHSQEHFVQILDDIDVYEDYCKDNPDFKNNKAVLTIEKIKLAYKRCLEQDDFL